MQCSPDMGFVDLVDSLNLPYLHPISVTCRTIALQQLCCFNKSFCALLLIRTRCLHSDPGAFRWLLALHQRHLLKRKLCLEICAVLDGSKRPRYV